MRTIFPQVARGLVLFAVAAGSAIAGSFQVSPVSATLTRGQPVIALTVRNTGAEAAVIQLEAKDWSQSNGEDKYVPATDILATPPIFTIAPGGTQVIRVGSRRSPDTTERTYRLFLREVPPPLKPGFSGLRMSLQISLPVFVQENVAATPQLEWRAEQTSASQVRIHVTNHGQKHARLSRFKLSAGSGNKPLPMDGHIVYVLPGATHDWLLNTPIAPGAHLHLAVQSDSHNMQTDLIVAGR
jgi:fimbrial chaperone protein